MKALLCILALMTSACAHAVHISDEKGSIDSDKVVVINGEIREPMLPKVLKQLDATRDLKGPRIVMIHSPGGRVDIGEKIINALVDEQKVSKQPIVCIVVGYAHSMAFNILTHCNERHATAESVFIAHKVSIGSLDPSIRKTAKNLREIADELDETDKHWDACNAKAMHMTVAVYSSYADVDYEWSVTELQSIGYMGSTVTLSLQ